MAGLSNLTQRQQYFFLAGFVGLAAAGLYWYLVYAPKQRDTIDPMALRVETLDSLNRQARQQMNRGRLAALRAEAEQAARTLDVMRQLVPSGNEVPALLEQVSDAGRRAGLEIAGVQPQPVIEGDQFDTYRYRMTVIGSYHRVGEFLSNVGSLPRIMAPMDLSLEVLPNEGGQKRSNRNEVALNVTFELQTYVAKGGSGRGAGSGEPRT